MKPSSLTGRLERDELQSRDLPEVALVACGNGVPAFQGASADEQIVEWDRDTLPQRLGVDLPDQLRSVGCNRMDRHRGLQVVEERTTGLTAFGRVGAMDTVREFGHAYRAERRFTFADPLGNVFEEARHIERCRSASITTLESRITPRWAGSMAGCAPLSLLRRPS